MSRVSRVLAAAAAVAALLPAGAHAEHARLTPTHAVVRMAAGSSRSMAYTLTLPPKLRPVDVLLLVDTSASMAPYLPSLRRGLRDGVAGVHHRGGDVRWGVAEFRTTGFGDWRDDLTYRVTRKIGAVDAELAGVLDRLGADAAGAGDAAGGHDAHTIALDEAVTGDGHAPYVPPGRAAGFGDGRQRVVVVVTDEAFAADPLERQPSRADAIATLKAAGAHVVGLALDRRALPDLDAVAAGTGSAARSSFDCGGGRVQAGRASACVVSPGRLAATLERMVVDRVRIGERGDLTVSAAGTGIARFDAPSYRVDRSGPVRVTFTLQAGCAKGDAGRTHEITLVGRYAGQRVAQGRLQVECV